MAFSKGFVGHIMGDLVGFAKRGVLCTRESGGCTADDILYMPEWGYMSDLDTFYFLANNMTSPDLPTPGDDTMGQEAYEFIAQSSVEYAKTTPSFAPVTAAQVKDCADNWRGNMQYIYDRAAFVGTNQNSRVALMDEISWFSPGQVAAELMPLWLEKQANCSTAAVQAHYKALLATRDPQKAVAAAAQAVNSLYAQGSCNL